MSLKSARKTRIAAMPRTAKKIIRERTVSMIAKARQARADPWPGSGRAVPGGASGTCHLSNPSCT